MNAQQKCSDCDNLSNGICYIGGEPTKAGCKSFAQYKKIETVTESKRGGKREHAGAKLKHGEPTAVIRLPVSMIERIKSGEFDNVTSSNDATTEFLRDANFILKTENDKLLLQLRTVMGSARNWVDELEKYKAEIARLENDLRISDRQYLEALAEIEVLKTELATEKANKPNSEQCQFIRSNGDYCTRKSSKSLHIHNLNVSLCSQHFKELSKH